ncbi:MAG: M48 family metallopeptidase [Planctomycetaceae bacterium]|nr:M48 family metallopeptidase [Planctomycetaceae bacterium]
MSKTYFYTIEILFCLSFAAIFVFGCSQNQVADNNQPEQQKITQPTPENNSETNDSESNNGNLVTDLFNIGLSTLDKARNAESPADLIDAAADGVDSAARSTLKTADEFLPAELEDEIKFGKMFNEKIIKESNAREVDKNDKRLYTIWKKLHPKRTDIKYRLFIIEKETVNAFAHAGGYVYIYAGLVEKCNNNDDAIAFVLAHEIGHIDLKHVCTRLGRLKVMENIPGSELINAVADRLSPSYNHEMEFEADAAGWQLALNAGYRPKEMIKFFDILPQETIAPKKNKSDNTA